MKIRVVEFRYVHSNPGLWLVVFTVVSFLFMLALVYCLQQKVLAPILGIPLIFYVIAAFLYERARKKAPSLVVDVDSIHWNHKKEPENRLRLNKIATISLLQEEGSAILIIHEKSGTVHQIALPGIENRMEELAEALTRKTKDYDFSLAQS